MNKINIKSIFFALEILAILAFGVITIPVQSYGATCSEAGCNTTYNTYSGNSIVIREDNPVPVINSISPDSSNVGVGTKTITITGRNFIPNSVAKINSSNRPTTFIDSSHLLMQVTGNDTLKYHSNGGFFVTVWNGAPGGGYSNAVSFTINKNLASASGSVNAVNDTSTNFTDINAVNANDSDQDYGGLAAGAIFGSNSIYPTGLIQWIFFAILILLIVILVRRVYGADKRYHAVPLKHD